MDVCFPFSGALGKIPIRHSLHGTAEYEPAEKTDSHTTLVMDYSTHDWRIRVNSEKESLVFHGEYGHLFPHDKGSLKNRT
jgi:hypothetical protein